VNVIVRIAMVNVRRWKMLEKESMDIQWEGLMQLLFMMEMAM
jgi:hypothetical protein